MKIYLIYSTFKNLKEAKSMGGQLVKNNPDGSRPGYYGADYGHMEDPGTDFGKKNTARISLVLEKEVFSTAVDLIIKALTSK